MRGADIAAAIGVLRRYWMVFNDLLVPYGQNLCTPLSPWCSRCRLSRLCRRVGVGRAR